MQATPTKKDFLEHTAELLYGSVHYAHLQQQAKDQISSVSTAIPGLTKRIVLAGKYEKLFRLQKPEVPIAGYVVAYPLIESSGQERHTNALLKYFVETERAFYKYAELASFEREDDAEEGVKRNISDFQSRFMKRTGL